MIPSDDQMDQLLRTFFDREVPADLDSVVIPAAILKGPDLTIVATHGAHASVSRNSRGPVVVSVIVALAACVIAAVALGPQSAVSPNTESTMPVSAQGKGSDSAIGDDRTSLEEIDAIEIKGSSSNR
ncbi:MAG: hypothetical protein JNL58_01175 [Planctomyces sp.]|nr:hypothetical protein [Planctomyces sp.]